MPHVKTTPKSCHCFNIRRTSGIVTEMYNRHLQSLGITISQYALISNLSSIGTASITELAGNVGLDRTTLVRNLKPLIERKLIEDLSEPEQRSRVLTLTQAGQALLLKARLRWQDAQNEFVQKIGRDNAQFFKTVLELIQE